MFKNSFKLLTANFSTVWKLVLYYLIVIALLVGLIYPVYDLILPALNAQGAITNLLETAKNLNISSNIPQIFNSIFSGLGLIFSAIFALFTTNFWLAFYIVFIVFYLMPFLFGLADLPIQETLFGYMSSLTKYGFVNSYVRKLGKSALFQLFKCLIMLPVNALIIYVLYQTLSLTTVGGIMVYFLPFIFVIVFCLLLALKRTLFSGWVPAIVVYDCNMFIGLTRGFKALFRRFWKSLSTALIMMLCIFAVNYLFGTFAFLITIPVSIMLLNVFEMVMFYGSQGMRYYVDLETIVTPKRLEEKDSFRKIKNII